MKQASTRRVKQEVNKAEAYIAQAYDKLIAKLKDDKSAKDSGTSSKTPS